VRGLADSWRQNIVFRLGAGIVLAVVLSTGVYTTYVMHTLQIEADQHLHERVERQASVLSHALARPLFDINGAAVASVVDALGAVDYITKPVSPPILFARVATQLTLAGARRQLQAHNENLEKLVQERTAQLALMQEAIIMAMGTLAEARDNTAVAKGDNHTRRTQNYVRALARHQRLPDVRARDCPLAPGKMGRLRLSRPSGGRADPAVGAADGRGRRVRCADLAPRVQTRVHAPAGAGRHAQGPRHAFRSGRARRVLRDRGPVRRHRRGIPRRRRMIRRPPFRARVK
jgi:hypothetical protein